MNYKRILLISALYGVCLAVGCQKDSSNPPEKKANKPAVITSSVSSVTENTAVSGGNVTSDGGATVTIRGIVWSTGENPTVESCSGKTTDGSGTGTFTSLLTGLASSMTYYVRSYATNSVGTAYGDQRSFTTAYEFSLPVVTTSSVTSITSSTASSGGEVISDGGGTVSARGIVWAKSENPTVESCSGKTTDGSGIGSFSSSMTGLNASTVYYIRSYATNSKGTAYGEQIVFTTIADVTIPVVTTSSVTSITSSTASSGGEVISDGGGTVSARGVVWATNENPTVESCAGKTIDGSGTGSFASSITNLSSFTTYYVRAYATNTKGTAYGEQAIFTTKAKTTGTGEDIDNEEYVW